MNTVHHLARGCRSIGTFDNPSDRDEALLAMLTTEVAEVLASGGSPESGDNEYPYGVDVSGRHAEMVHRSVDEDGVIEDLTYVESDGWVEDDGDEGCWYRDKRTWDQAMWWHEPPADG